MKFDLDADDVVIIVAALKELTKNEDLNEYQRTQIANVFKKFIDIKFKQIGSSSFSFVTSNISNLLKLVKGE